DFHVTGVQTCALPIYSTAMPPAQAVALSAALQVIRSAQGDERREKLAQLIARFRRGVQELTLQVTDSTSAIQPLIVGDNLRALRSEGRRVGKERRCGG